MLINSGQRVALSMMVNAWIFQYCFFLGQRWRFTKHLMANEVYKKFLAWRWMDFPIFPHYFKLCISGRFHMRIPSFLYCCIYTKPGNVVFQGGLHALDSLICRCYRVIFYHCRMEACKDRWHQFCGVFKAESFLSLLLWTWLALQLKHPLNIHQ